MIEFEREKKSTLAGATVVRYTEISTKDAPFGPFFIEASAEGIRFEGQSPLITSPQDYEVLARIIGQAGTQQVKLRQAKHQHEIDPKQLDLPL